MDKLPETRRDELKKMSTVRLTSKLIRLGYSEELLETLDRPAMLNAFAELIVAGKDKPIAEAGATAGAEAKPAGIPSGMTMMMADPELQKQFLELEKSKFEEAKEKLEWEKQVKQEELDLRRREIERQENRDRLETARHSATVAKVKLFGDAFKNSAFPMGNQVMDALPFFEHCERIFADIGCPAAIQAQIIRPYLSERAKQLLSRLDPTRAAVYAEVKQYILSELKLSPAVYLDKFNNLKRNESETCVSFLSKLKTLFSHYVQSRHVGLSYQKLVSLILSDKIKSTLSESCLNHILSCESNTELGWLEMSQLADQVDLYIANHPGDRPKVAGVNFPTRTSAASLPCTGPAAADIIDNKKALENEAVNNNQRENGNRHSKRCYRCGSLTHLQRDCKSKSNNNFSRSHGGPRNQANVNASLVAFPTAPPTDSLLNQTTPTSNVTANRVNVLEATDSGGTRNFYDNNDCTSVKTINTMEEVTPYSNPVTPEIGAMQTFQCSTIPIDDAQAKFQDIELAKLKYVDISIDGVSNSLPGLSDTGAMISICHSDIVRELNPIPIGNVMLRGILGEPVMAKLINLSIKLADSDVDYIPIIFAVCDDVNENLIIASNVMERLSNTVNSIEHYADIDSKNTSNTVTVNQTDVSDNNSLDNSNDNDPDVGIDDNVKSELGKASADLLRQEQLLDSNLTECWNLAKRNKGNYLIKEGLLYRNEIVTGQRMDLLVVPSSRYTQVLALAHSSMFGGHMASLKTMERIRLSGFTWPKIRSTCKDYIQKCQICQKRARITCFDRVPISSIPTGEEKFSHWFIDCFGPLFPNQPNVEYNYGLLCICASSRWPAAFALKSLTAKNVCTALLQLFMQTGLSSSVTITSDNASNFASLLTREFMQRVGVSPRFSTPGHPQGNSLSERCIGSVKQIISKVAFEHPKSWHKYLPFVLWALREAPNEVTGIAPFQYVYGIQGARGPLAILKESWIGEKDLPFSLGKTATEFLQELGENLKIAKDYAEQHSHAIQNHYVNRYNLRSRDKCFDVGEKCLILIPDSTASKVFSRWKEGEIKRKESAYSYLVETTDGRQYHLHANKLRKFHIQVDEITCSDVPIVSIDNHKNIDGEIDCECAIVYERDSEFGPVEVVDTSAYRKVVNVPPSQKIDSKELEHLSLKQRTELLSLLDEFPECFSETPGLCNLVEQEIQVTPDFKPKRLKEYRVPQHLKPEVDRQIKELLDLGFIVPSKTPMASPIVAVLKGPDGKGGVRVTVNYQYVNRHTICDSLPLPNISDIIHRVGNAKYISVFDAKSGYWQCPVKPQHQWLTGMVCDNQVYTWTRTPFGMRNSGSSFVRAVQQIIEPIREFTDSYVDEMTVFSDEWHIHLIHIQKFLETIKCSGLTLNLKKCHFAKPEVIYVGHVIGSSKRRPDPSKVSAVHSMKIPETKKQVRQILGFFSHFRDYIPSFSEYSRVLSDLTGKRVPARIPWGQKEQEAFDKLKQLIVKATVEPIHIVDMSKSFSIYVDASEFSAGAILCQPTAGKDQPVAFASTKFTPTQRNWSTIEREAYAAIFALQRFKHWIFGTRVTLFSDHNPLLFLSESAPKSSKLMRWALALQEYNIDFKYRAAKLNEAADCLSRMVA